MGGEAILLEMFALRIPAIVTARSDASQPSIPIDRDQCEGAVRFIFDLSVCARRQAGRL